MKNSLSSAVRRVVGTGLAPPFRIGGSFLEVFFPSLFKVAQQAFKFRGVKPGEASENGRAGYDVGIKKHSVSIHWAKVLGRVRPIMVALRANINKLSFNVNSDNVYW